MEFILAESQFKKYISDKVINFSLIPAEVRRRIGLYIDIPMIQKYIIKQVKEHNPEDFWGDYDEYTHEIVGEVAERVLIIKGVNVGDIGASGFPAQEKWSMMFELIEKLYGEEIQKYYFNTIVKNSNS